MRAVVQERYGRADDLRVREVPEPEIADDEVLVRVAAASVHPDVWHVVTGRPYALRLMGGGLRRPTHPVPGTDLAGEVVEVGAGASRFAVGDLVFGETLRGYQWKNGGAYAELAAVPEHTLARVPHGADPVLAATVPTAGLITLLNLPEAAQREGARVLVNGAAGGVGVLAVQIAKAHGARVTAVDLGTRLDPVRDLGVEGLIDARQEDFTRHGGPYDVIFDVPGNRPFRECRRVLAEDGAYVLIGHDGFGAGAGAVLGSIPKVLGLGLQGLFRPQLSGLSGAKVDKAEGIGRLAEYLADGTVTPVLDRAYPLEAAGDAITYLASGQARGRIVLVP